MANPRSTASIAGHPIHPMLVSFPIAFFVATLACDLAFWQTGDQYWATTGLWLLGHAGGKDWQMVYRHHVGVADDTDPRAYRDPAAHRLGA